jgi:CTP-dependent riboflavin kinase
LDELLRDIEESIADLRRQLEWLESSDKIRTLKNRDGKLVDTTDAHILWLKRLIAGHERIAAKEIFFTTTTFSEDAKREAMAGEDFRIGEIAAPLGEAARGD